MIAPLMYLIVFGMGIQTSSHGEPYLNFLIPGVVSLTTMNGSFNAIAQNLNVQRLYEKAFDQVMISPTPLWQFYCRTDHRRQSPRALCRRNHPSSDHADRNRSCVQRMVIAGDVPQRCCIFSHRCCGFFPCQKTMRMYLVFPTISLCQWLFCATPSSLQRRSRVFLGIL